MTWPFGTPLERARARAKRAYLRWQDEQIRRSGPDYGDCGQRLFDYMFPQVYRARVEFEEAYAEVRRLDPDHAPLLWAEQARAYTAAELQDFEGL